MTQTTLKAGDVINHPVLGENVEVISVYTRAQAIDDGFLVELADIENRKGEKEIAKMIGQLYTLQAAGREDLTLSVCTTNTVFTNYIALTSAAKDMQNDIDGRAWDVLWMMRGAFRRAFTALKQNGTTVESGLFELYVVSKRRQATRTVLKMVLGPDDEGKPCITIMMPNED